MMKQILVSAISDTQEKGTEVFCVVNTRIKHRSSSYIDLCTIISLEGANSFSVMSRFCRIYIVRMSTVL